MIIEWHIPLALNPACSCIPSSMAPTPPATLPLPINWLSLFKFSLPFANILPAISTALLQLLPLVTMADDVDEDDDVDGDIFFFFRGGWPSQEVPVGAPKLVSLSILRNFTKQNERKVFSDLGVLLLQVTKFCVFFLLSWGLYGKLLIKKMEYAHYSLHNTEKNTIHPYVRFYSIFLALALYVYEHYIYEYIYVHFSLAPFEIRFSFRTFAFVSHMKWQSTLINTSYNKRNGITMAVWWVSLLLTP